MSATSAAWTALGWLFAAAAIGFSGAWVIQWWRIRDGRAAGRQLEADVKNLQARLAATSQATPPVPVAAGVDPDTRELQHWKNEAQRLGDAHRKLVRERAEWQGEAMRMAAAHQAALADVAQQQARAEAEAARAEIAEADAAAAAERSAAAEARAAAATAQAEALAAARSAAATDRLADLEARLADAESRRTDVERQLANVEARDAEAEARQAAAEAEQASGSRELALLRQQLGAASQRVLDLEQELNRLQLERISIDRLQSEQNAAHAQQLQTLQDALAAERQAVSTSTDPGGPASPAAETHAASPAPDEVQLRLQQQRLQELEETARKARRLAQEHRAEVAGLKSRIEDLENRLQQLWEEQREVGRDPALVTPLVTAD